MEPGDKPRLIRKVSGWDRTTDKTFIVDHGDPLPGTVGQVGISGYTLFMREYSKTFGHLDHWICFHQKLAESEKVKLAIQHCMEVQEMFEIKNQAA